MVDRNECHQKKQTELDGTRQGIFLVLIDTIENCKVKKATIFFESHLKTYTTS